MDPRSPQARKPKEARKVQKYLENLDALITPLHIIQRYPGPIYVKLCRFELSRLAKT